MKTTSLFLSLFAAAAVIGCTAQGSVNIGGNTTPSASPSPSPSASSGASVGANVGVNVGIGGSGSTSGTTSGSTSGSASTDYVAEMKALSACLNASGAAGVQLASAVDARIPLVQSAVEAGRMDIALQQYELSKNTVASLEGQNNIDCVK